LLEVVVGEAQTVETLEGGQRASALLQPELQSELRLTIGCSGPSFKLMTQHGNQWS
jgi:hypothetical protein